MVKFERAVRIPSGSVAGSADDASAMTFLERIRRKA